MLISIQNNDRQIKRIEAFADTHGWHREYQYDPAATDILVCSGDVCEAGNESHFRDFFAWFAEQPAPHKLFVAGNHDLPFDLNPEFAMRYIPRGVTCIEAGNVTLDGVHFFVLPARYWMHESDRVFLLYPHHIDVLVTHGAPKGILDDNGRWGCPILREFVDIKKPKVHIFGHAHEDGGQEVTIGKTRFLNVAVKLNHLNIK